ncbi:penicillin-binding protein [Fictibacillus iocasae]|uniref:Penicillin-binding protein n=1 Tax=Fictibacillus iocasae TaxID=2715437 RepID=A0ABW2NS73_9BACL
MKKNKRINSGARFLSLIFILLFSVLTGKFFFVTYTGSAEGVDLIEYGKQKWIKSDILSAKRGNIYDRSGEPLAQDIPAYTVIAILKKDYPVHVKDPEEAAKKLAPILDTDKENLETLLKKDNVFQVEIPAGRNISHSKKEKIEALKIAGISFDRGSKRYYPNQDFASHVIGFTGVNDAHERTGLMGLEKSLEKHLGEKDGRITFMGDRYSNELPDSKEKIVPPKNGLDIHLTLDEKIQMYLDQAMSQADKKYKPKRIVGIVADPKTGKILAMSSRPSFNPNKKDITNYTNYAISSAYEPGSTMKIFTLAAAIEEKVYNGNASFQSGSYKLPKISRPIYDHNRTGWGSITFDKGVENSSNVAFSILAREKLGYERLRSYLSKFGLDKETGIDLPKEASGKVLYNFEIEKVTTAFGQGTTVTPIQQIQAATAIANGGKMMKPYVIEKITDPKTGQIMEDHEPLIAGRPISEATAKQTRDILEKVVVNGTGRPYAIEGYSVAGKTGTAQVTDEKTGMYLHGWGENIFSFLGMVPKDNPRLLMYVAVDRPSIKYPEMGYTPVANIFTSVMKSSLQYLNIVPEEAKLAPKEKSLKEHGSALSSLIGENAEEAAGKLKNAGYQPVVLGDGSSVVSQEPYEGAKLLKGERVILFTGGTVKMPNLNGWSYMDILRLSSLLSLKETVTGSGFVSKQNIKKDSIVKKGDFLVVQLKPAGAPKDPADKSAEEGLKVTD